MQIDNAFITRILEPLKITVDEASKSIMDVYHKDTYDTETKSDGSPVTEADNRSNEIIIKSLKNISNDIPILTEEIYEKDLINTDIPYWLVDPLDGTKEFINKSNDFTVNIALIEDSKPIFGIIGAPATGKIWHGSHFNNSSNNHSAPEIIRIVMSKSHQTEADKKFLDYIGSLNIKYEIIEKGSSLKLCALSDDQADIYPRFGPTSEWDIAAGHAVLNSCGGSIIQMANSKTLGYSKKESILNPSFIAFRNRALEETYMPILSEFYKKLL